MKKLLLAAAATMLMSTGAHAGVVGGTLNDLDGSFPTPGGGLGGILQGIANVANGQIVWGGTTPNNDIDEATDQQIDALFTLHGTVNKYCVLGGVDIQGTGVANNGDIDLGTIGVRAKDDIPLAQQFVMTGPINLTIGSVTGGCNTKNNVQVTKSSSSGLINSAPGPYDSNQFQANIPYSASFQVTGVDGNGNNYGLQSVTAGTGVAQSPLTALGAWRSNWALVINAPAVTGKGLVAGTYSGTVTVTVDAI